MSVTTFSQGWAKQTKGMKAIDRLYKALGVSGSIAPTPSGTGTDDLVDLVQTYQTTAQSEGDEAAQALSGFSQTRASVRTTLKQGSLQTQFNPTLKVTARSPQVSSSATSASGQIQDLYYYMQSNTQTVTSRGFVRGSWSAGGSNAGNGTWLRLWIDQYGWPIEVGYPETVTYLCMQDAQSGAAWKGREQFRLQGQPFVDELTWTVSGYGSGLNALLNAKSSDDSQLANPSFSTTPAGGDATPNGSVTWYGTAYGNIAGWLVSGGLVGDGSDIVVDRTNYFLESQNENGSPAGLRIKTSKTILQPLKGPLSNNVAINAGTPKYAGIWWRADLNGQWTGTIVLTLGSKTYTVTVTSQTGWQLLDNSTDQQGSWFQNWGTSLGSTNGWPVFQVAATKTSGGSTYLVIDCADIFDWTAIVDPQTNGVMEYQVGRSGTALWVKNDTGTVATTEAQTNALVVQPWSHRTWGTYWPSRPAAPTAAAPSVALSATAGSVTTGTHVVAVSFVSTDGIESPVGSSSGTVTGDGAHKVDVTNIPTGPSNVAKRKLYMSKAGTSTPLFYAGITINDNVTTSATGAGGITVADGSLSVQPSTISIAEP